MKNSKFLKKNVIYLNKYLSVLFLKYMNLNILKNKKKLVNRTALTHIRKHISNIKSILKEKLKIRNKQIWKL